MGYDGTVKLTERQISLLQEFGSNLRRGSGHKLSIWDANVAGTLKELREGIDSAKDQVSPERVKMIGSLYRYNHELGNLQTAFFTWVSEETDTAKRAEIKALAESISPTGNSNRDSIATDIGRNFDLIKAKASRDENYSIEKIKLEKALSQLQIVVDTIDKSFNGTPEKGIKQQPATEQGGAHTKQISSVRMTGEPKWSNDHEGELIMTIPRKENEASHDTDKSIKKLDFSQIQREHPNANASQYYNQLRYFPNVERFRCDSMTPQMQNAFEMYSNSVGRNITIEIRNPTAANEPVTYKAFEVSPKTAQQVGAQPLAVPTPSATPVPTTQKEGEKQAQSQEVSFSNQERFDTAHTIYNSIGRTPEERKDQLKLEKLPGGQAFEDAVIKYQDEITKNKKENKENPENLKIVRAVQDALKDNKFSLEEIHKLRSVIGMDSVQGIVTPTATQQDQSRDKKER